MTLARLRADAVRRTLFPATTLKSAIRRLGFVQADPIRAPARAQDLILRHRVTGYIAGDLERRYASLDIEEDLFYAYGFLPRENWRYLHPRVMGDLNMMEQRVIAIVRRSKQLHPRELEAELGRARIVNYWGGYSKETTRALEQLHYRGLLRIARREGGIRIYQAAPKPEESLAPEERVKRLVLLIARALAPIPAPSLRRMFVHLRYGVKGPELHHSLIEKLLKSGELDCAEADGVRYVWPAGKIIATEAPRVVRFLAPFDPLVWDRRRFEHFWGWAYRFEGYTPPPKRVLGYYAMPLLWGDAVVGWANIKTAGGGMTVDIGYSGPTIRDRAFRRALDEEIDRMRTFLSVPVDDLTPSRSPARTARRRPDIPPDQ